MSTKLRAKRIAFCTLALIISTGCQDRVESENEATEVAIAYLENISFETDTTNVEVIDMGDRWRVSFRYPEGSTGGPVIVVVNKHSGKVVHAETEQ